MPTRKEAEKRHADYYLSIEQSGEATKADRGQIAAAKARKDDPLENLLNEPSMRQARQGYDTYNRLREYLDKLPPSDERLALIRLLNLCAIASIRATPETDVDVLIAVGDLLK